MWCVFFGLGCYLRKIDREYSLAVPIAFVIIGVVLQYAECRWLNSFSGGGFGIKMSAWVYSIAVILLLFSARLERAYKGNAVGRFVEYVGSVSFAVYLYHLLVLIVLARLGVGGLPWIGRWAALMLATLGFVEASKRILPKKAHWLIGA